MALRDVKIEVGQLDRSAPFARSADGKLIFKVRCRVPFTFDAPAPRFRERESEQAQDRAEPEAGSGRDLIEGIASSTSVDWYDTRMAMSALESMRAQFVKGVDYFPRHHGFLSMVEWDEIIGRTIGAKIERAPVKNPKEEAEAQAILTVTTQLDTKEPLAQKLIRRIEDGRAPGQSIGGWFTEMEITYEEDDDGYMIVNDIVILDVELDHLAAVRSPANPDADKVYFALTKGLAFAVATDAQRALHPMPDGIRMEKRDLAWDIRFDSTPLPAIEEQPVAAASRSVTPFNGPLDGSIAFASTSPDAIPPRTEAATEVRENNEENSMDPKELQALVDAAVARALQAQAAETRAEPTPNPTPAPEPAPTVNASVDAHALATERTARIVAEARAKAAEAQLEAMASAPAQRAATRPVETPAAPANAQRNEPAPIVGPGGINLRKVAPMATQIALRAGLDITPGLVMEADGIRAIVEIADAEGATTGRNRLAQLAKSDELLTSTRKGAVRALAARYGHRDAPTEEGESRWDRGGLEDLLHDIVRSAVHDRLITEPSPYTSWS